MSTDTAEQPTVRVNDLLPPLPHHSNLASLRLSRPRSVHRGPAQPITTRSIASLLAPLRPAPSRVRGPTLPVRAPRCPSQGYPAQHCVRRPSPPPRRSPRRPAPGPSQPKGAAPRSPPDFALPGVHRPTSSAPISGAVPPGLKPTGVTAKQSEGEQRSAASQQRGRGAGS
jgi:hypothetical protein